MKRLLREAKGRETGREVVIPGRVSAAETIVGCWETGMQRATIDRRTEYAIQIMFRQNFWANQAQYHSAREAAVKALASYVFAEVLRELPHLRLCIESGDAAGALEIVDRIEEATKP